MIKMFYKFLFKSFFLLLIIFGVFCSFEIFLRFFNPQVTFDNYTTSKFGVPTAFRSKVQRKLLFKEFPYEIKTDSKGLRNFGNISYKKEPDVFRILCIGGSIFAASGVNNDETFAFFLDRIANENIAGKKIEVINAGKNQWELSEYFTYFKNEGYKFNPDLVIAYFHRGELSTLDLSEYEADKVNFKRVAHNRIEISIKGLHFAHHLNKFTVNLLNFIQSLPFYEFSFSKFHSVRFIEDLLRKYLVLKFEGTSKNNLTKFFNSFSLKDDDLINFKTDYLDFRNKTIHNIPSILYSIGVEHFFQLLQKLETKLVFLLVPSRGEVLNIDKTDKDFKPMQIAHHENLIWLDLKKGLMEAQNLSYVPLNFPKKIHFTPAGHLAVATLVFNKLIEKDFLPSKNYKSNAVNFRNPTWLKLLHNANNRINSILSQLGYNFLIKGLVNKNQKKFEQAEKYLKLASKKKAVGAEAAWQLGRLNFTQRNFNNSIDYIQKSLEQGLYQSDAVITLLAKAHYNLKRMSFAEKYFKKAIKIAPTNYRNYVNYAQMLFFSKRFEESLTQFKKANLIVQDQIDILLGIGSTSFLIGKNEEALRVFEKILIIQPNNLQAIKAKNMLKKIE